MAPGRPAGERVVTAIYLDHNATTPLAPGVLEAITRYLTTDFGNPSSGHVFGSPPREGVAAARQQVAELVGTQAERIVFTGCGSEANALAITGSVASLVAGRGGQVITQATEHPAVLQTCQALVQQGIRVTVLPVDADGLVDPADLAAALTDDTLLVTVMHANNETGTIQPIAELAALTHSAGAMFHTDAAQTTGKVPYTVDDLGVDLLIVAGHKFGGPKGVGALYIREGVELTPLIRGGGQERSVRSGTENVAGIAGMGAAAGYSAKRIETHQVHLAALRDQLHRLLLEALGDRVKLNGHPTRRLPNTLNVSIMGTVGAQLLATTPRLAASTGSACHDGSISSPVLAAMGHQAARTAAAIRLSVGAGTNESDIHEAADMLITAARRQ
jgi:cysteine desulfurase